ncbi:MAG: endonuclease domain-containing protein [Desulfobaccales bacterium]
MLPFNRKLKGTARALRKNMTDAERLFWMKVRKKQLNGHQFYRQKNLGNYIVDFYCPSGQLIIEIDGGQHYSDRGIIKDKIRDSYLNNLGFKVVRFSDNEILTNIDGVLEHLFEYLS